MKTITSCHDPASGHRDGTPLTLPRDCEAFRERRSGRGSVSPRCAVPPWFTPYSTLEPCAPLHALEPRGRPCPRCLEHCPSSTDAAPRVTGSPCRRRPQRLSLSSSPAPAPPVSGHPPPPPSPGDTRAEDQRVPPTPTLRRDWDSDRGRAREHVLTEERARLASGPVRRSPQGPPDCP